MEHSKGKLEIVSNVAFCFLLKIQDSFICTLEHIELPASKNKAEANAQRLVKCWNEHDDLLAACGNGLEKLTMLLNDAEDNAPGFDFIEEHEAKKMMEQAIEKAK